MAQTSVCDGARKTQTEVGATSLMTSELEAQRWSVLSDRGCEAGNLTHEEARRLVHRLGGEGRHGLVIVTDEAAGRMISGRLNREQQANVDQT